MTGEVVVGSQADSHRVGRFDPAGLAIDHADILLELPRLDRSDVSLVGADRAGRRVAGDIDKAEVRRQLRRRWLFDFLGAGGRRKRSQGDARNGGSAKSHSDSSGHWGVTGCPGRPPTRCRAGHRRLEQQTKGDRHGLNRAARDHARTVCRLHRVERSDGVPGQPTSLRRGRGQRQNERSRVLLLQMVRLWIF